MRRAGKVVREVLELVRSQVKPGATTLDLEKVAEARIDGTRRQAGIQGISRFSLRALHFGQQRSGARHSIAETGPAKKGTSFRWTAVQSLMAITAMQPLLCRWAKRSIRTQPGCLK